MGSIKTHTKVIAILAVAAALVACLAISSIAEAGPSEEKHETAGSNGISISVVGGTATEVSTPAGVTIPQGYVATSFKLSKTAPANSKFAQIAYADEAWNTSVLMGGTNYSNSAFGFFKNGSLQEDGTLPGSGVRSFTVNDADGAVVTLVSYPTTNTNGTNSSATSPQTGN